MREKGQFWTPLWVAEAMVGYVLSNNSIEIFDPAVGAGAFFIAAKQISKERNNTIRLAGIEIDLNVMKEALNNGLTKDDLSDVQIQDFVMNPPRKLFKAIVANPPYIRHHRLSKHIKYGLQEFGKTLIGRKLDGRAGYHIYFLLRALQLLDFNGNLSFIMPADTCEGVFANSLWKWITENYCLEAVITFSHEASPFPNVDTNPLIFLIKKSKPKDRIFWVRVNKAATKDLKEWALFNLQKKAYKDISIKVRKLKEALDTGLSRPPNNKQQENSVLADFAYVQRGIATGENDFFFLTKTRAAELGIPNKFLLPAIGRTRDVKGDEITEDIVESLEKKGRPTMLFSPNGCLFENFPKTVQEYLKKGENSGINKRALISTRNPWYKMEVRKAPPFLFAYLGRRNARFIRNKAGVMPLTGFLCVYPKKNDPIFIEKLWEILKNPLTQKNLSLVGKSYGSGAIKVEPRALERLPIPNDIILNLGLQTQKQNKQLDLF